MIGFVVRAVSIEQLGPPGELQRNNEKGMVVKSKKTAAKETGTALDLSTLTSVERFTVESCANEVWNFMHRTARHAMVVGRKLQAVKKILGHGRFIPWLRAEFDWSEDTAERLMNIADRFGEIPQTAEFALTALYSLVGDGVPEAARREAVARAAKGEKITLAVAKAIKAQHAAADVQAATAEVVGSTTEAIPDNTTSVLPPNDDKHRSATTESPTQTGDPDRRASVARSPLIVPNGDAAPNSRLIPVPAVKTDVVEPDDLIRALGPFLSAVPPPGAGRKQFARQLRLSPHDRQAALAQTLTEVEEAVAFIRQSFHPAIQQGKPK